MPTSRATPRRRAAAAPSTPKPSAAMPPLGPETIAQAALALIDRQGLAAFNLRELARDLGVYPTAIYWHVHGRDALMSSAVSLALRGVADDLPDGRWQDRLTALLQRFRAALHAHPRLAPLVASELVHNPALDAALVEHVVRALEDAGFDGSGLVDAYNVVIAAMCGFATLELSTPPADAADAWQEACQARLAEISADAHPALARHLPRLRNKAFMLRWSGGATHPMQASFDAWCAVFIAGLEANAADAARHDKRTRG